jgi:hypothetical protein
MKIHCMFLFDAPFRLNTIGIERYENYCSCST